MPDVYDIAYLRTGESESFYCADGLFYKVSNNAYIRLQSQIAWCPDCGCFVDAEDTHRIDENGLRRSIERDRNRLKNFDNLPPDRVTEKVQRKRQYYSRTLVEAERTIEWRLNRVSKDRCLICGETGIIVPEENEPIFIPGKGKVKIDVAPVFADVSYMMWVFSSEGLRIEDDGPRGS